jgi:hypothetical protein
VADAREAARVLKERPVMKARTWSAGLAAAAIWAGAWVADAATFYWRHAGRDPFLGPIGAVEELRTKLRGKEGLLAERLRRADPTLPWEGIAAGTAEAFESLRGVRPETLRDGARAAWMIDGHGVRRDVVVVGDRPGYRVSIFGRREGKVYDFHWASACGNVTPLGTRPFSSRPEPQTSSIRRYYRDVVVLRPMPLPVPLAVPMGWPVPYPPPLWAW